MRSNRREFLRKAGIATMGMGMFPTIVKSSVLGLNGRVSPSNKIPMIVIGCGAMGNANLNTFISFDDVKIIAVCDVDHTRTTDSKKIIDTHYGNNDCRMYGDFREMLEQEQSDTAAISLPDHWHAIISCATANKKIDIYGEKPLARYLRESRAIADTVKRNQVIWQTGSQQRSVESFRHAASLVRNGVIGNVSAVEVGLPDGGTYIGNPQKMDVPENVNWDMWLGPAPKVPFRGILHWHWRWIMEYSGGQLTDWAGHHIDIAHWGLGLDHTGPLTIKAKGRPNNDGIYNVPVAYDIECEYANGLQMRIANQSRLSHGMGVLWKGSNGWIHVNRHALNASDEDILKVQIDESGIHLYESTNHQRNFIDCVKSREAPITPAETGHRSISVAYLAEIAMKTGQKLYWDPQNERFTDNNIYATRLLQRPYRAPWKIPV